MDDSTRKQLLQVKARLSRNPDFKFYLENDLRPLLALKTQDCVIAPEPALFQGAAQVLQRLIAEIEAAEELYRKEIGPVPLDSGAF